MTWLLDTPLRRVPRPRLPFRLRFPRVIRPARGQLRFVWIPWPVVVSPPASPRPIDPPLAPRRPRLYQEPGEERRDWQTDRWVSRHAGCLLCGSWPAVHHHMIDGRQIVVCNLCEHRPDMLVRVAEVLEVDWSAEAR
jgi:hypothetical protein